MARKKWSKLSKAEKKAFRDGDRSIGKKEYRAQREAKRPVTTRKAASSRVQNVSTKLTEAKAAGRQKKAERLAGKLDKARSSQVRRSDIRKMVKESGGNIRKVNKKLKQENLRSGAQKFLSKKLSTATNKSPTEITKAVEPQRPQASKSPSVVIRGGVNNVNNDSNISLNTGTVPNEPPARPDISAPAVGNQISSTSNQTVGYNGVNEITNSTVMGGVGNVDNSNNSSFFQGSQAFQSQTPSLPEAESGATATPVSNVIETNKTQEVDYNGQNTISNSFIGGGVGNVNNADYSVTIQGGGEGGGLNNMGAAAAANALNENQYERSQSKVTGSSIANKYIANMLGGSGIMNTINNAQNRSNEAQAYMGARATQQRDLVMGNYIKPAVWEQPEPLKAVESKVEELAKRYDFS